MAISLLSSEAFLFACGRFLCLIISGSLFPNPTVLAHILSARPHNVLGECVKQRNLQRQMCFRPLYGISRMVYLGFLHSCNKCQFRILFNMYMCRAAALEATVSIWCDASFVQCGAWLRDPFTQSGIWVASCQTAMAASKVGSMHMWMHM